jgi:hypothetical protein
MALKLFNADEGTSAWEEQTKKPGMMPFCAALIRRIKDPQVSLE